MDQIAAYITMGTIVVLTVIILALVADGWDGWR